MSCNTCAKSFSILRKEHGCPGCGFSYCLKCLSHIVFLPKLNAEAKVCVRCKLAQKDPTNLSAIEPPAAFLKRLESLENPARPPITMIQQDKYQKLKHGLSEEDQQIVERLRQLKEDPLKEPAPTPEALELQITERLQKLRGPGPAAATDDEVRARLSVLKGEPVPQSSAAAPISINFRTNQEQSEDLLRQYMQEVNIDKSHKDAFDSRIGDIESRLHALTGSKPAPVSSAASDSEDETEMVQKVIEKAKAEAALELEVLAEGQPDPATQELPWCEVCNEDARMRCVGCRYLFCKQCYLEHKDQELGCDAYELYRKPSNLPA